MFLHSLHYFPNVVLTALETKSFIFTPALEANILLVFFFYSTWKTSSTHLGKLPKTENPSNNKKIKKLKLWFGPVRVLVYHYLIVPESPGWVFSYHCATVCSAYCQSPHSFSKKKKFSAWTSSISKHVALHCHSLNILTAIFLYLRHLCWPGWL